MATAAFSHCEIPCGIYDDEFRFRMMREHVATIEKSIEQATQLEEKTPQVYNQLVRWIDNKERHARKLQEIVWQYVFTQRIKPVSGEKGRERYLKQLELLHLLSYYAMKSKQSLDLENARRLRALIDRFEKLYFGLDGRGGKGS